MRWPFVGALCHVCYSSVLCVDSLEYETTYVRCVQAFPRAAIPLEGDFERHLILIECVWVNLDSAV